MTSVSASERVLLFVSLSDSSLERPFRGESVCLPLCPGHGPPRLTPAFQGRPSQARKAGGPQQGDSRATAPGPRRTPPFRMTSSSRGESFSPAGPEAASSPGGGHRAHLELPRRGRGGSHLSAGLLRCEGPPHVPRTPSRRQLCGLARSHRYLSPNLKRYQSKGKRTAAGGAAFAGEPSLRPTSGARGAGLARTAPGGAARR